MIPDLIWRGILVMGLISFLMLRAFGWRTGDRQDGDLHLTMLLLGAGFMLLETKGWFIWRFFGSTWIVNAVAFSAVLVMILIANLRVPMVRQDGLLLLPGPACVARAEPCRSIRPVSWVAVAGARGCRWNLGTRAHFLCRRNLRDALPALEETGTSAGLQYGRRNSRRIRRGVSLLIGYQYLIALAAAIYLASWALAARRRSWRAQFVSICANPGLSGPRPGHH